jgi:SNF2 family DNA or RNA helicase
LKFKIPPWEHQHKAIAAATGRQDGYAFFMEMGTGKTCSAINTLRWKCYQAKTLLRTLVFCPPVVRVNWRREFEAHSTIHPGKVHVLEKSQPKRLEVFSQKAFEDCFGPTSIPKPGVFITNYESLQMKMLFELFKTWRPQVVIFDEAHKIKNPKAKRTKLALELADLADYKLLLTGTPILNSPMDVWALFRALDGGETFERNFFAFRAKYFMDRNAGMPKQKYFPNWQPIPGVEKTFHEKIYRKAIRVMKKDCLDLPPLVKKRIHVEMSPEQAKAYREMEANFIAYLEDKACVASLAITKALRLQQMVSGFIVDDEGETSEFKKQPRLEALKDILGELVGQHKVIVWSHFRPSYAPIARVCDALGVRHVTLYGGMTDRQRQAAIDDFQTKKEVRVIIANQAAGGTGVNLTAASYAVYFSRGFKLEDDLQSEARAHRGGSEVHEKITRIDLVTPETIDEVILDALAQKENMAESILKLRDHLGA